MSRSATIPARDATFKRVTMAVALCTNVTLPRPQSLQSFQPGFCQSLRNEAEDGFHPLDEPRGTRLGAGLQRCAGMESSQALAQAHLSSQTARIAIFPEEEDRNGPCHLTHGVLIKNEKTYARGNYGVSADGCKRLYNSMTGLAGWGCEDDGTTKRLTAYPYALLPQLLLSGSKIFKFAERTCEELVDKAVRTLLSPDASAAIATPFNLTKPNGGPDISNSYHESEHNQLLSVSRFLRNTNRRLFVGLKRIWSVINAPLPRNGPVFAVQDGRKKLQPFSSFTVLGSEITRHAAKCRSGFYDFLNVAKDKFLTQLQGLWDGFNGSASTKGIAIPKSLAKAPEYCDELWNQLHSHPDWKCAPEARGRYRLDTCPKGLERVVPSSVWDTLYKSCEDALYHARKAFRLVGVKETRWTIPNPTPSAEGAYNRVPLDRVGIEPREFDVTGAEQEDFIACYPEQNQDDAFYDALSVAAAEMQNNAPLNTQPGGTDTNSTARENF